MNSPRHCASKRVFADLCRHSCVKPRLGNVLSHEPHLHMRTKSNVQQAHGLFWSDVPRDSSNQAPTVGNHIGVGCGIEG